MRQRILLPNISNKKDLGENIDVTIISGFMAKNVRNKSLRKGDKIAILSMEIVHRITARLLYILAFPAFVTPGWYYRQKIRYRFVPLLANLYPLIIPSLVYNTHDCNLDNIVCFAFVARR